MRIETTYWSLDNTPFSSLWECQTYESICKDIDAVMRGWSKSWQIPDGGENLYWKGRGHGRGDVIDLGAMKEAWVEILDLADRFVQIFKRDLLGEFRTDRLRYVEEGPGSVDLSKYFTWIDTNGEEASYDCIYGAIWHFEKVDPETGIEYLTPVFWQDSELKKLSQKQYEEATTTEKSSPTS